MAIRKMTEGVTQWRNNMFFPQDGYKLTCIEEEFAPNNNGNPMITRVWEITSPETIKTADGEVSIAGQQIRQYLVTKVKDAETGGWDEKKSDKAYGSLKADLLTLGFTGDEIDDENPPLIAKGKTVDAICYGKKQEARKSPTPEQLAKGQRVGDPILGSDGKPVINYQPSILQISGLAANQVDVAF